MQHVEQEKKRKGPRRRHKERVQLINSILWLISLAAIINLYDREDETAYQLPPITTNLESLSEEELLGIQSTLTSAYERYITQEMYANKGITEHEEFRFTFQEAAEFLLALDNIYDQLPPMEMPITQESLEAVVMEVNPYFVTEGFRDTMVEIPSISFVIFPGLYYLYALGLSDCYTYVEMSERMTNSFSSWDGKDSFLATVIHELGHMNQGLACDNPAAVEGDTLSRMDLTLLVEETAQVMMFEVLAALANEGNPHALRSLVHELRYAVTDITLIEAIRENRTDDFRALYVSIYPETEPIIDRMLRGQISTEIIERYSARPIYRLLMSYYTGRPMKNLALPKVQMQRFSGNGAFVTREVTPDDLIYSLDNMNELIELDTQRKTQYDEE